MWFQLSGKHISRMTVNIKIPSINKQEPRFESTPCSFSFMSRHILLEPMSFFTGRNRMLVDINLSSALPASSICMNISMWHQYINKKLGTFSKKWCQHPKRCCTNTLTSIHLAKFNGKQGCRFLKTYTVGASEHSKDFDTSSSYDYVSSCCRAYFPLNVACLVLNMINKRCDVAELCRVSRATLRCYTKQPLGLGNKVLKLKQLTARILRLIFSAPLGQHPWVLGSIRRKQQVTALN